MSPKYSLNKQDFQKIAQAFAFSMASAAVAFIIMIVEQIDFAEYAFVVPVINAILYGAKRYLQDS